MNGMEKLYAAREIRSDYRAGEIDLPTAIAEVHEVMIGNGKERLISPSVIDFLRDGKAR